MSNQYGANVQSGSQDVIKEGFVGWLERAIQKVRDWIVTIPAQISDLWNTVIDFIAIICKSGNFRNNNV